MADLQWLEGYSSQTVDELIALEPAYRVDSLVLAFEQAIDQKAARVGEQNLTEEERIVLAIEALEREVNNGGYGQFFVNASRDFAPMIVNALQRIGCPITAEITQKAVDAVHRMPMLPDEVADGSWENDEERSDALAECDSRFFEGTENIEQRLFAFIEGNRHKIGPL
jgi:hypothetical protein